MAELAALGVASNIVQLVHFSSALFSKAREIAGSAHGVGEEEIELETIGKDLKSLLLGLQRSSGKGSTLNELVRACGSVADELIRIIEDLKARNLDGRKWASFKQAVSLVRKEKDIQGLEIRLHKLQTQISTHLLATFDSQQSSTMTYIDRLIERTERLEMSTTNSIETLRSEILDALRRPPVETTSLPLANVGEKLAELTMNGSSLGKQQEILESLSFSAMHWRFSSIKKEHKETFRWIFKSHDSTFVEWLKTGNGIYWIEGKAGSGKSTLMKYLVNESHTRTALNQWAGDNRRLLMASCFFWAAGSPMQRSQEGLLRTILFQVLRKYPDLISSVSPERWADPESPHNREWDYDELSRAVSLAASQTLSQTRFCFFVDGMDEFSGDQRALVQLIKRLANSPSIKLCISSRPWNVFVNAFDGKVAQLKLENLTSGDIQRYAEDKLNSGWLAAGDDAHAQRDIVAEIARRARGVFLWVYLVVDSLLRGQEEGDDIRDMRRRLDALPDDLEEFFKRILSTVDKVYREQTAKIFLVMVQAKEQLPILAFHYLEQEETKQEYATELDAAVLSSSDFGAYAERMKRRINARCRDLLEITPNSALGFRYHVDFLHRTVRDFFLETPVLDDFLKPDTKASFDPLLSLCRIMLALTKTTGVLNLGQQMMQYASCLEAQAIHSTLPDHHLIEEFGLLDELQRVWRKQSHVYPARTWLGIRPDSRSDAEDDENFICECIDRGLSLYLRHRLSGERIPPLRAEICLFPAYGLHETLGGWSTEDGQGPRGLDILRFLLEEKHLSPNEPVEGETVWILFMKRVKEVYRMGIPEQREYLRDAVKLFLRNGANPNALWRDSWQLRRASVVVRELFAAEEPLLDESSETTRRSLLAPGIEAQEARKKSPVRTLIHWFRRKA
ncbi:hypothetical protein BJX65DRAFT_301228 [Aspergillus insuetus]